MLKECAAHWHTDSSRSSEPQHRTTIAKVGMFHRDLKLLANNSEIDLLCGLVYAGSLTRKTRAMIAIALAAASLCVL
jgi:alkylhydroperoxidase/carboxymuconolactone decarboxylase family protein YurZ